MPLVALAATGISFASYIKNNIQIFFQLYADISTWEIGGCKQINFDCDHFRTITNGHLLFVMGALIL